jgi:heme O synthase-like polyprenyltransferase
MMSSSIVAEPIATSTWQGTCRRAADYLALTKPRVVLMVLIKTFVGFYLGSPGHLHWIIDYLPSREQQFLAKLAAHCLASFPGGKEI